MNEYEISGIENIARGVCVLDGKVLLCRGKGLSSTYLPGGHIEFGETGREALVREIKEEMGLKATAGELLGVIENSFLQHGKRHCEINLVYEMRLEGLGGLEGLGIKSQEDWIGFEWADVDKLDEANLLPESIRPLVTSAANQTIEQSEQSEQSEQLNNSPHLHVVATPIGNLGDLSPRAVEAFRKAAVIACEDTRRTWQLLTHFGIPRPPAMFSYRQGNEERITERVVADLRAGKDVVLCSDGGYPGISDPGYRLIRTCAQEGVAYEVIPGASAVNVALLMSGLSTSSFTFRGFPPRGPGALRNWFKEDADKEHTLVCYESPFRIGATLEAALDALGDREAAVCIELTKLHERVSRGYLSDLAKEFRGAKVKGEVALVIAGSNKKFRRA